ncbi:MAG: O-antigen ligase family protein [Pseudomonadota bacterium]
MVLWPVLALLGTQGFTPLLGIAALIALAFLPPLPRPSLLLILFASFIIWVSAATSWSPAQDGPLFSGSLATQNFAVDFSPARLMGMAMAALITLGALNSAHHATRLSARVITAVLLIHIGMVLITPPLLAPGLAIMYDDPAMAARDGMQNVLRFANASALAAPVVLAAVWTAPLAVRLAFGAAIAGLAFMFALIGNAAGLLALAAASMAIFIVLLARQRGFVVLFAGLATLVLAAPGLGHAARLLDRLDINLPLSFQSRIWAWQAVSERVFERPWLGHGLEAASTWRETYTTRPEWLAEAVARGGEAAAWQRYPVVPSHPHNMALEIWAETGAVGAMLAAGTLMALGLRLAGASALPRGAQIGAAGLTGAATAIACVSYSAWNEAFWAGVTLLALCLLTVSRAARGA